MQDDTISAVWEKMIRQLAENEKLLSDLYGRYAELFPESRSLWTFLMHEEEDHAELWQNLLKPDKAVEVSMPRHGIRLEEAVKVGEFITKLRQQAKPGNRLTLARALTNAVGIESNIVEAKMLEGEAQFATEWTFQSVATVLLMETQNHLTLVEKALAEVIKQSHAGAETVPEAKTKPTPPPPASAPRANPPEKEDFFL